MFQYYNSCTFAILHNFQPLLAGWLELISNKLSKLDSFNWVPHKKTRTMAWIGCKRTMTKLQLIVIVLSFRPSGREVPSYETAIHRNTQLKYLRFECFRWSVWLWEMFDMFFYHRGFISSLSHHGIVITHSIFVVKPRRSRSPPKCLKDTRKMLGDYWKIMGNYGVLSGGLSGA